MTTSQRNKLMIELWPAAARAQGWKVSDRDLRLRVLSIALSFEVHSAQHFQTLLADDQPLPIQLASASDIDADKQFTAVKALLLMLSDNVSGAKEVGAPEINKGRQKLHVVLDLMRCLAIYPHEKPMGMEGAEKYVRTIVEGKFKRFIPLEELTIKPLQFTDRKSGLVRRIPSQLDQLLITLDRRLNYEPQPGRRAQAGYRVAAGHTEHQMRKLAGVKCKPTCKECHP